MNLRKYILILIFLALSPLVYAQHKLQLNVEGVPTKKGTICYAVYTNESSFLKFDKVYKSGMEKAEEGKTTIEINDLPDGEYAVAIFHDANSNKKLDTNMLGIPKEQVAFTKGRLKMFGPPKFKECAFILDSNLDLTVTLE
ncbi:DUF2141 domain-containing protein [Maribacter confluentis]|nr:MULTISPECIES: DUF2141 domain-containing protein [Maribacter]MDO1513142.1 DUF2141 domain-containing protein [Maribacter confluentis]